MAKTYAVLCDRCGFQYKNTQLRTEWNGLKTCSGAKTNNCYDPRHPQELVKGKVDKQTLPWVRPDPEPIFTEDRPPLTQDDL